MSWNVSAIGKPAAVAASVEQQFAQQMVCAEPEETVRQSARATIAAALAAQRPDSVVQVNAGGSMSAQYNADTALWDGPCTNQVSITVQPQYGFVE